MVIHSVLIRKLFYVLSYCVCGWYFARLRLYARGKEKRGIVVWYIVNKDNRLFANAGSNDVGLKAVVFILYAVALVFFVRSLA